MPLIYQSYSAFVGYINLYSGDCTISVSDFDGDGATSNFELDASLFDQAGQYIILKSFNDFTNYVGAIGTWVGTTSLTISSVYKTTVTFPDDNITYYCLIANIV